MMLNFLFISGGWHAQSVGGYHLVGEISHYKGDIGGNVVFLKFEKANQLGHIFNLFDNTTLLF